ncbi:peptidylprolyl isomerase [Methylophilaceae bacterium]|nr:peptidylprolyl isomerase [Methylophilaceae bacterium]
MNNYLIRSIFFLYLLLNFSLIFAYQEMDRIIAIINKDVITLNDLSEGVDKALLFFQQNSIQPPEKSIVEKKVLDELIEQKIIEGYAEDWNIKASQEEVDLLMQNILSANEVTIDELKLKLKQQNSSYDKLLKGLKYEIIFKKVKSREISSKLNISDYEIKKHKEKMAKIKPDIYDLSHILVKFSSEPTAEEKIKKRKLGEEIFNKLKTEDFAKIAYEFSDSPDAKDGGALGKLKQSELPEIFIEKINDLSSGEYSTPFESNNGIHIVKVNQIESYNETKNASQKIKKYFIKQIVLKTSEVASEDDVIKKLKRYKNEIESGADFSIIAKKYSEDFSATNGGEIGWISEGLDQNFDDQFSIIEKNEVSEPFKTDLGWHIIQYSDYKFDDAAAESIDNKIKLELINERTELLYQDWFTSLKNESFIEIRE